MTWLCSNIISALFLFYLVSIIYHILYFLLGIWFISRSKTIWVARWNCFWWFNIMQGILFCWGSFTVSAPWWRFQSLLYGLAWIVNYDPWRRLLSSWVNELFAHCYRYTLLSLALVLFSRVYSLGFGFCLVFVLWGHIL